MGGGGLERTDTAGKGMDTMACQWNVRGLGYMCISVSNLAVNGRTSEKCNTTPCIVFCHRKSIKKIQVLGVRSLGRRNRLLCSPLSH